ncbi:MAG: hypothetical protein ABW199_11325 [Caulobacterales bacterium]
MATRMMLAMLAFALTACGQPNRADAPPPPLLLTCADFPRDATAASLAQIYGAENVTQETLPGPEGEQYKATVLYANNPLRRAEIVWRDDAETALESVTVRGDQSEWNGPAGIKLGQAMTNTQRANGPAFMVSGFDWDYGGVVTDWKGGSMAPANGCNTMVQFKPTVPGYTTTGDAPFSSDDEALRAAIPRVQRITISFGD